MAYVPETKSLDQQLLDQYGPTLGGKELYAALGFRSYSAFHRSMQLGELGINVFTLPGRRGWFALTTDVAAWLTEQAKSGTAKQKEARNELAET